MIANIISVIKPVMTVAGVFIWIVIILVYVSVPVLIISLMIRLVKYLKTAGNERKLLRLELGKLADEVQQIRQELKAKPINQASAD